MKRQVLNLGCGRKKEPNQTIVLDKSQENLDSHKNVKKIKWDLNKVPFPIEKNSIDEIYFIGCLEHLTIPPEVIFIELHRILKLSGILRISLPNLLCLKDRIIYLFGILPSNILKYHRQYPSYSYVYWSLRNAGFQLKDRWNLHIFLPTFIRNLLFHSIDLIAKKNDID